MAYVLCLGGSNGGGGGGTVGCGSLFHITTVETTLFGASLTISDTAGHSMSASFDSNGICEVVVPYVGSVTVTPPSPFSPRITTVTYYTYIELAIGSYHTDETSISAYDAFGIAKNAIDDSAAAYVGLVWHTHANGGYNTWYCTTATFDEYGVPAQSPNTNNDRSGDHIVVTDKLKFTNTGNSTTITALVDGYLVISQYGTNNNSMPDTIALGNIFDFRNVSAGQTVSIQSPRNDYAVIWAAFYEAL